MFFKHRGWYIRVYPLSMTETLFTLSVTIRSTISLSVLFGVLLLITSSFFFSLRHPICVEYKLKYNMKYIYIYIYSTLHLSKDQPEDGPTIGPKYVAGIII